MPRQARSAAWCSLRREPLDAPAADAMAAVRSCHGRAVLLLCDVALGAQHELIASQFEASERSKARGKNSTWGIGKTAPDPSGQAQLPSSAVEGAVTVPMGKGVPNKYLEENMERIKSEGGGKRAELLYNEFIVYDTSQIRCQYVVVVDFEFL